MIYFITLSYVITAIVSKSRNCIFFTFDYLILDNVFPETRFLYFYHSVFSQIEAPASIYFFSKSLTSCSE